MGNVADSVIHGERRGRREWDAALHEWVTVELPPLDPRRRPAGRKRGRWDKQRQRERARAEGKCPTCCVREADPPYKTCSPCRKRGAERFRELHRLAGLAERAGLA